MVITLYNILLDTPHFLAYLASVGFGALRQGGRLGTAKTTAVRPNTKLSCAAHNSYIAGVETPKNKADPCAGYCRGSLFYFRMGGYP